MFTPSPNPLPIPVEVVLTSEFPPSETGLVHVGLQRLEQAGPARRTWKSVITVSAPVPLDPDSVLAQAHGFLADDRDGPIGVVDEVIPAGVEGGGTIVVACGWFGRHLLLLAFEDVVEILPAEQRLILRPGLPAIAEARRREHSTRVSERVRALLDRPLFGRRRPTGGPGG